MTTPDYAKLVEQHQDALRKLQEKFDEEKTKLLKGFTDKFAASLKSALAVYKDIPLFERQKAFQDAEIVAVLNDFGLQVKGTDNKKPRKPRNKEAAVSDEKLIEFCKETQSTRAVKRFLEQTNVTALARLHKLEAANKVKSEKDGNGLVWKAL